MPRTTYEVWNPSPETRATVERADTLARSYARQGYDLTLRQLYYQFVARGWLPNTTQSYKRLGDIVAKARMAGMIDWYHITDRTRHLSSWAHSDSVADDVSSLAGAHSLARWDTQPVRVEVWVEKEALAGVVSRAAMGPDVAYFSCRGYVSLSEMWAAARRLGRYLADHQRVVILHLGDHDPSGIDMTRDIRDRLENFITQDWLNGSDSLGSTATIGRIWDAVAEHLGEHPLNRGTWTFGPPLEVRRIALNMDQVEQYDPPPNPAKVTDSRFEGYRAIHGDDSWELDALEPSVLDDLITAEIDGILDTEGDRDEWERVESEEERNRSLLRLVGQEWPRIVDYLTLDPPEGDD